MATNCLRTPQKVFSLKGELGLLLILINLIIIIIYSFGVLKQIVGGGRGARSKQSRQQRTADGFLGAAASDLFVFGPTLNPKP